MAYTQRGSTTFATGTTSAAVTKPTGVVDGDLLVAVAFSFGAPSPPAGWTQFGSNLSVSSFTVSAWWKVAASEGASFTFTGATATDAAVTAYVPPSGTLTIDVGNGQANTSSTSCTAPSITLAASGDLLVFIAFEDTAASATPPSGLTETFDNTIFEIAHDLSGTVTSGATGTKVATLATAKANGAFLVGFKSAATSASVTLPLATATGTPLAPFPKLALTLPLAIATGAPKAPTTMWGGSLVLPLATATVAPKAPFPSIAITMPLATATGAGLAPSTTWSGSVSIPLATATITPIAPGYGNAIFLPTATATVLGLDPSPGLAIGLPLATATGTGLAPTVNISVAISLPTATANALGYPTNFIINTTISLPLATALLHGQPSRVLVFRGITAFGELQFSPVLSGSLILIPSNDEHDMVLASGMSGSATLEPS